MKIEIDTSQELSAIDKSILAVLCGNDVMTITETHAIGNMSHTVTKTTPQQTQIELHTHIAAADNPATGAIDSSDPINMGFGDAPQVINPEPTLADITVDKHGTPYDNRIHSTPCSTNKDGSFRRRKGIDDAEFERISNELRGVAAIPTPAPGAMLAPPPPPPPLAVLAPYIPASTPIAPPPPPPVCCDDAAIDPIDGGEWSGWQVAAIRPGAFCKSARLRRCRRRRSSWITDECTASHSNILTGVHCPQCHVRRKCLICDHPRQQVG